MSSSTIWLSFTRELNGGTYQVVINAAVQKYVVSNPLHPDVFPGMHLNILSILY